MTQGRPKKSTSNLPSKWADIILRLGTVGASEVEMRVALGCISDDLWYRLLDEGDDFSRTVSRAKLLSQNWWERKARENLENTKFNTRLWQLNMMNRFKWFKENSQLSQSNCFKCVTEADRKKYGL